MLKKNNLEIMTVIFFGMITICAVFSNQLGLVQRIMLGYMFLFTLHEWEETRYPGGFAGLMVKFFGLTANPDKIAAAHIPVAILLIVITFVPFFTQLPILALVPVYLGLFETIIHLLGIKLHKMNKPYTPGMITGIMLGITSVIVLATFSQNKLMSRSGYVWGIPLMIFCFAAMQRTVLAIYGLGYKFIIENVKKKLKRQV